MKIWLKFILEKMNKKSIILDVLAVLSSRPFKRDLRFESIAKTNTTHTGIVIVPDDIKFEGIAKINTTHDYSKQTEEILI